MNTYIYTENGKYKELNIKVGSSYQITKGNKIFDYSENINNNIINKISDDKIINIFQVQILGEIIKINEKSFTDHYKIIRKIQKNELENLSNGKIKYDENGNLIYWEKSNVFCKKIKYNENNNIIYAEDSNGDWEKYKYDQNNNLIYYESSIRFWKKRKYDKNNNKIYFEDSSGLWVKYKFDQNNNQIYVENSYGFWEKKQYDQNNNPIYLENSNMYILKIKITEDIMPTILRIAESLQNNLIRNQS
jgi:hypothetical protein